jgi:hypothetical protein
MSKMESSSQVKIVDITKLGEYEKYLYKCLAPMPFRRYRRRQEYLKEAIPKRFHKKVLIFNGEVVGTIEYAPADASGYPITGDGIVVMNCVWVLRKAKGHDFGRLLVENMTKSVKDASGFATIALENHWSPWFKKQQIEKLGFKPLDSIKVAYKTKRRSRVFSIYLMWMPIVKTARPPTWDRQKLLDGETFCLAHPLYRPQTHNVGILEAK